MTHGRGTCEVVRRDAPDGEKHSAQFLTNICGSNWAPSNFWPRSGPFPFLPTCTLLALCKMSSGTTLPKRVSFLSLNFLDLGCLTFEVTCARQRDALARQGIMSIARTAGQVWHAVARQVHRRVRLHSQAKTPHLTHLFAMHPGSWRRTLSMHKVLTLDGGCNAEARIESELNSEAAALAALAVEEISE
jgi:hypothetical protein